MQVRYGDLYLESKVAIHNRLAGLKFSSGIDYEVKDNTPWLNLYAKGKPLDPAMFKSHPLKRAKSANSLSTSADALYIIGGRSSIKSVLQAFSKDESICPSINVKNNRGDLNVAIQVASSHPAATGQVMVQTMKAFRQGMFSKVSLEKAGVTKPGEYKRGVVKSMFSRMKLSSKSYTTIMIYHSKDSDIVDERGFDFLGVLPDYPKLSDLIPLVGSSLG